MSTITERAEALAKAHPASEVLENAFLGVFTLLGGFTGYVTLAATWLAYHAWTFVFVVWLAFSDGFKRTARVQPKPVAQAAAAPLQGQILDDPRYTDHTTPFGVPFGPNVHGSHE